jgi:hypothetical protein
MNKPAGQMHYRVRSGSAFIRLKPPEQQPATQLRPDDCNRTVAQTRALPAWPQTPCCDYIDLVIKKGNNGMFDAASCMQPKCPRSNSAPVKVPLSITVLCLTCPPAHALQMHSRQTNLGCSTRTTTHAAGHAVLQPCRVSCRGRVAAASSKNGSGRTEGLTDPAIQLVNGTVTEGPDLSVVVNGMKLPNPFVIGSGPPGTNYQVMKKAFDEGWGAVICKTLSLDSSKVRHQGQQLLRLAGGPGRRPSMQLLGVSGVWEGGGSSTGTCLPL